VYYLSAGPLTIQAGNITVDANVTSTTSSALVLKSMGNITQNANRSIQTNAGEILFWADTDVNGGYIYMLDGATLDSRSNADRTAGNTSTAGGGGRITLAGGLDNGTNGGVAGDGLPDGRNGKCCRGTPRYTGRRTRCQYHDLFRRRRYPHQGKKYLGLRERLFRHSSL
jgi:hypothetical protein